MNEGNGASHWPRNKNGRKEHMESMTRRYTHSQNSEGAFDTFEEMIADARASAAETVSAWRAQGYGSLVEARAALVAFDGPGPGTVADIIVGELSDEFAANGPEREQALRRTTFHLPPANARQTVEVAYTSHGDMVVRRRYDRSDRSTDYAVSRCLAGDNGDYRKAAPKNKRWRTLTVAKDAEFLDGRPVMTHRLSWEERLASRLRYQSCEDAEAGLPIATYKQHAPRRDKKGWQPYYEDGWNGWHDDRRRGRLFGIPGDPS